MRCTQGLLKKNFDQCCLSKEIRKIYRGSEVIHYIIVSYEDRSTTLTSHRRFVVLVLVMLGIALGHLFVIGRFDSLVLGLPAWLWVQVAIVAVLFGLAWIATDRTSAEGTQ